MSECKIKTSSPWTVMLSWRPLARTNKLQQLCQLYQHFYDDL